MRQRTINVLAFPAVGSDSRNYSPTLFTLEVFAKGAFEGISHVAPSHTSNSTQNLYTHINP